MVIIMYALNVRRGTTIQHPEVKLIGGIAVRVDEHLANQLKHIINVVVFDSIFGIDDRTRGQILSESRNKPLYGLDKQTLEPIEVK